MSMFDRLPEWAKKYAVEYPDARVEERYQPGMTERMFLQSIGQEPPNTILEGEEEA